MIEEGEKKRTLLGIGVVRIEDRINLELIRRWSAISESLRNPEIRQNEMKFDSAIGKMSAGQDGKEIFRRLEKEMKDYSRPNPVLEIRGEEADAFFAYASAGSLEEKMQGLRNLYADAKKAGDAISKLEKGLDAGELNEPKLAKITELSQKENLSKKDVQEALGKNHNPELADAIYVIISKQEASSVAARNALEMDRLEYEKIFGINQRNTMLCMLFFYRKILGDANFNKAKEALMKGRLSDALAELQKMGIASQYLFLSLLAPKLVRGGMWNEGVLKLLAKAIQRISQQATKNGQSPDKAQIRYMKRASSFISRFGDFTGLNLSLFTASFLASMK